MSKQKKHIFLRGKKIVSAGIAFSIAALAVTAGFGQIVGSRECGDAIYRSLNGVPALAGYDHAGLYYRFIGGDRTDLNNHRIIHVQNLSDVVIEDSYADFCSSSDNNQYYGAYTNPLITPAQRAAIVATMEDFRDNTNLNYTVWGQIDWEGSSWDGTIGDLENIRCDGFVECCYEMNGVDIWGKDQTHYSIVDYPEEHNDMPDFVNNDHPPEMMEDPDWEVSPKAQRGGLGEQYTKLRLSIADNPTVTCYLAGSSGIEGWYRSDVTVTLTASDQSGIIQSGGRDYIRYSRGVADPWETYTSPLTVTQSAHFFTFSVDKAGNAPDPVDEKVYIKIDKLPPPVTGPRVSTPGPTNDTTPTITGYTVVDNGDSGIRYYEYKVGSGGAVQTTIQSGFETPALSEGIHTIYVRAVDKAGNAGSWGSCQVEIDLTAEAVPTIDPVISPTGIDTQTVTGGRSLATAVVQLNYQEVDSYPTSSTWEDMVSLTPGYNYIRVRGSDAAGNWSGIVTAEIIYNPAVWEFNQDGDIEGWGVIDIYSWQVAGGFLTINPEIIDPYIEGPDISVPAVNFDRVEFRMRSRSASNSGQFFWRTAAENTFTEPKTRIFTVIADGDFHVYTLNLADQAEWTGTITGLRLDPVANGDADGDTGGSDDIDIDYIRLLPAEPPLPPTMACRPRGTVSDNTPYFDWLETGSNITDYCLRIDDEINPDETPGYLYNNYITNTGSSSSQDTVTALPDGDYYWFVYQRNGSQLWGPPATGSFTVNTVEGANEYGLGNDYFLIEGSDGEIRVLRVDNTGGGNYGPDIISDRWTWLINDGVAGFAGSGTTSWIDQTGARLGLDNGRGAEWTITLAGSEISSHLHLFYQPARVVAELDINFEQSGYYDYSQRYHWEYGNNHTSEDIPFKAFCTRTGNYRPVEYFMRNDDSNLLFTTNGTRALLALGAGNWDM
ncbi:MAG TPA: hypothetical protein ENH12_01790, partial [Proteobacteria bacterium]|nr:hypothetical protein [Pseudomonadota bacterium]